MSRTKVPWSALLLAVIATVSLNSMGDVPGTGSVTGRVKVLAPEGDGLRPTSNVVVVIEDVPNSDPSRLKSQRNAKITQRDRHFVPEVTVIPAGGAIEFPNEDFIDHNVFSLSRTRVFDLGLYRNPDSKSVTFQRPGVVDVYCNIHPDMAAKIKIVDTVHYAQVKADGTFSIANVPPGVYPLVAWQPYGEEYRGQVTVESGKTAKVELSLREGPHTRQHANKEGKLYGRYH
jgi:plastocyanin